MCYGSSPFEFPSLKTLGNYDEQLLGFSLNSFSPPEAFRRNLSPNRTPQLKIFFVFVEMSVSPGLKQQKDFFREFYSFSLRPPFFPRLNRSLVKSESLKYFTFFPPPSSAALPNARFGLMVLSLQTS